jgi:glycosyltransferase involved in cell wall biosynthesis
MHTFAPEIRAVYLPIAQGFPALFRDLSLMSIAHLARKPVIVHLHGGALRGVYESQPRTIRRLMRAIVGRAALGIVLTSDLRPCLECLLPPERVTVVENGIDLPPLEGERVSRDDDQIRVLFLSSLYRRKGVLVFVEAMAIATRRQPALRAIVAGDWPDLETQEETLKLVSSLGIEPAVTFAGMLEGPQKSRVFRSADIFCFPSQIVEGQPLVVLEAMAAGLPIASSGRPPMPSSAPCVAARSACAR